MDNKVTLSELADRLAAKTDITKRSAENFVRAFFDITTQNLLSDRYVKIKEVGTFKLVNVGERESVNVATGERFQIESHNKITFTAEGNLRDRINLPFASYANVELEDDVTSEELSQVDFELFAEDTEDAVTQTDPASVVNESQPEQINTNDEPVVSDETMQDEPPMDDISGKKVGEPQGDHKEEEPEATAEPLAEEPEEETYVASDSHLQDAKTESAPMVIVQQERDAVNWWKIACICLITIILMVASYFVGYYRLLCPCEVADHSVSAQVQKPKDVAPVGPKPASRSVVAQKNEKPKVLPIEQLPGGTYEITGTKEEHTLKSGESLRTIALSAYGNAKLAEYIVFYNKIKNPDIVPVGQKIMIPELVKKQN